MDRGKSEGAYTKLFPAFRGTQRQEEGKSGRFPVADAYHGAGPGAPGNSVEVIILQSVPSHFSCEYTSVYSSSVFLLHPFDMRNTRCALSFLPFCRCTVGLSSSSLLVMTLFRGWFGGVQKVGDQIIQLRYLVCTNESDSSPIPDGHVAGLGLDKALILFFIL